MPFLSRFLKTLVLFFVFVSGGACFASEPGPQLGLKKGQALSGRFVHEHPVKGFDTPLRSEGSFLFAPQNRMEWAVEKPMATTTSVDETGATQKVGTFVLLKISTQQMPLLAGLDSKILAALNGDWKKLEKDFAVKSSGKLGGPWRVVLTPYPVTRAPFVRLVASGEKFLDKLVVEMRETSDTILFTNQKIGALP